MHDVATTAGALSFHAAYDAFGRRVSTAGTGGDRFGYTGREHDALTDLRYHRARYVDELLGSWTQEDPIAFAAGDPSLHRYVGNQPTGFTDSSGLWGERGVWGRRWEGVKEGARETFWGFVDFVNPMTLPDAFKTLMSAPQAIAADLPKMKRLACEPVTYTSERYYVIRDGVYDLLETPEGQGKALVHMASFFGPGLLTRAGLVSKAEKVACLGTIRAKLANKLPSRPPRPANYVEKLDTGARGTFGPAIGSVANVVGPKRLTVQEAADIQRIADKYKTRIDVGGSRAKNDGRDIHLTELPVDKGPGTRSDIDFIVDPEHPQFKALMGELRQVGNGAGSLHPDFRFLSKYDAGEPRLRFDPGEQPTIIVGK